MALVSFSQAAIYAVAFLGQCDRFPSQPILASVYGASESHRRALLGPVGHDIVPSEMGDDLFANEGDSCFLLQVSSEHTSPAKRTVTIAPPAAGEGHVAADAVVATAVKVGTATSEVEAPVTPPTRTAADDGPATAAVSVGADASVWESNEEPAQKLPMADFTNMSATVALAASAVSGVTLQNATMNDALVEPVGADVPLNTGKSTQPGVASVDISSFAQTSVVISNISSGVISDATASVPSESNAADGTTSGIQANSPGDVQASQTSVEVSQSTGDEGSGLTSPKATVMSFDAQVTQAPPTTGDVATQQQTPCAYIFGLPKLTWAILCDILALAVVLLCIPLLLTCSRRRPPGAPMFDCTCAEDIAKNQFGLPM